MCDIQIARKYFYESAPKHIIAVLVIWQQKWQSLHVLLGEMAKPRKTLEKIGG